MPASYLGRRRSRPVADAPALDGADVAKAWLVELVALAPLERAARLPGPRFAEDAPRLCAAVVAALASDAALGDLEPGGSLAPLAAGSGHLAAAPGAAEAIAALDALRAVVWSEVLAALDRPVPAQVAELSDRLGAVITTLTVATLETPHPLGPSRPGDRGPLAAVLRDARAGEEGAVPAPTGTAPSFAASESFEASEPFAASESFEAPDVVDGSAPPDARAPVDAPDVVDGPAPPDAPDVFDGPAPPDARAPLGAPASPAEAAPPTVPGSPSARSRPGARVEDARHGAGATPFDRLGDEDDRDDQAPPFGRRRTDPRPPLRSVPPPDARPTSAADALAHIEATLRDAAGAADPLAEAAARLRALAQPDDPFDAAATRLRTTEPPAGAEPRIRRMPVVEDAEELAGARVTPWAASIERRLARHRADALPFGVLCLEVADAERLLAADVDRDVVDALEQVEAAILAQLRPADALIRERPGRYWLTTPDTDTTDARSLAHRIAGAVEALPPHRGAPLQVAVGVAACPADAADAAALEGLADEALFLARAAGQRVAGPQR